MNLRADLPGIERHIVHLERIANRIVVGLIASAIIIAIAVLVLAYLLS